MNHFLAMISGKDNKTPDVARILWVFTVLVYLGLAIAAMVKGQNWQPLDTAKGLAIVLVGGGIGVAVKAHTEPEPEQ